MLHIVTPTNYGYDSGDDDGGNAVLFLVGLILFVVIMACFAACFFTLVSYVIYCLGFCSYFCICKGKCNN